MPVAFDTTGMERHDERTWFDPRTGDQVSLTYIGLVPDLPASLDDLPLLRHRLAVETAEVGAIIEAHVVALGGVPAVFQLIKLPIPDQDTGLAFIAAFTMPKSNCSAVLRIQCAEGPMTGAREATVAAKVGFENCFPPHPYAPELRGQLPYNMADDASWDQQFPDHPLTRARAWAHRMIATARVDPQFAALPPFQPTEQPGMPAPVAPPAPAQPVEHPGHVAHPGGVDLGHDTDRADGADLGHAEQEPEPAQTGHHLDRVDLGHPAPAADQPSAGPASPPADRGHTAQPGTDWDFGQPSPATDPSYAPHEPGPAHTGHTDPGHSTPAAAAVHDAPPSPDRDHGQQNPARPTADPGYAAHEPGPAHTGPSHPTPAAERSHTAHPATNWDFGQPNPAADPGYAPHEPGPAHTGPSHSTPAADRGHTAQPTTNWDFGQPNPAADPGYAPHEPGLAHTGHADPGSSTPAAAAVHAAQPAPDRDYGQPGLAQPTADPGRAAHEPGPAHPGPDRSNPTAAAVQAARPGHTAAPATEAGHDTPDTAWDFGEPSPAQPATDPGHAAPEASPVASHPAPPTADTGYFATGHTTAPSTPPATPSTAVPSHAANPGPTAAPVALPRPSPTPRQPAEAGDVLHTVLVGLPVGSYLPLWQESGVTFWRMSDPAAVRARLGTGEESRSEVDSRRFREAAMFSPERQTLFLMNRYRDESGHLGGTSTQLTPATEEEAYRSIDDKALSELYAWLGEVVLSAVRRGEFVAIESGGWQVPMTPVVLVMLRTDGRAWHSVVETSPVPVGAPVWRDQQPVEGDTQVLASPATDQTIRASGLLTRFAVATWAMHPFQLGLSFGPNPTLEQR